MRSLNWPPLWLMALILVAYLLLGSIMESFAVMVITVPIITPLILDMGYNLVWWGVIMLCVVETGLIHLPLELNVFVLKSMLPRIPPLDNLQGRHAVCCGGSHNACSPRPVPRDHPMAGPHDELLIADPRRSCQGPRRLRRTQIAMHYRLNLASDQFGQQGRMARLS